MIKRYKCGDCGKELPRKELNRQFRCHDCARAAARDAATQLLTKSGPYYEKWKRGIRTATEKL